MFTDLIVHSNMSVVWLAVVCTILRQPSIEMLITLNECEKRNNCLQNHEQGISDFPACMNVSS